MRLHALAACSLLLCAAPARAQGGGAGDTVRVTIQAVPGLRFDRVRFEAPPGAPVKVEFRNADAQADMAHNFVVTRPGAREKVVRAALQATEKDDYVPAMPEVLHHTPLVQQGDAVTLTFAAPTAAGVYPYVCTFPGHGFVMYGAMYVGTPMPEITMDENVPPAQRRAPRAAARRPEVPMPPVSYGTTYPAVSRTFLPESGPASIAVGLPGGESFDFDAGVSYLRYAWKGGFVDNAPHWRGNGNAYARVLGEVYYRSNVGFPFRLGASDSVPEVRFRGYRLGEGGYPEFHYTVGGAEVWERVERRSGGDGLLRTFAITTDQPVRFLADEGGGVRYEASAGRWAGTTLTLTPAEARRFTLTMIPEPGGAR